METSSGTADVGIHVELYVRSLSPRESRRRLERVVERLERLATTGTLSGYRVVPTGNELPATPADAITESGEFLLNRVAVFEEWAAATDRSLGSLLERRTVFSQFTGEEHDALRMPTMVMAEYQGEDLRFVAPCEEGEERVTVLERLEALERNERTRDGDRLPRARATPPNDLTSERTQRSTSEPPPSTD